jgi:hypothetical protein
LNTLTSNQNAATYQWIDCATMTDITGATNQSYTAISNGNYAVVITNNGCSDTSLCYDIFSVGISKNAFATSINVYPNPANNSINFNLSSFTPDEELLVTDIMGRAIYKELLKGINNTIDVSNWSEGVYFYQLSNNKETIQGKFVVEK